MNNKILYAVIIALVIALLFSVERCSGNAKVADVNYSALQDTTKYYITKTGNEAATIKTLQLQNNEIKEWAKSVDGNLSALTKEFSKVKTAVTYNSYTTVPKIDVPFDAPISGDFHKTDTVKKQWYSFKYDVTPSGFSIDSLKIPNQVSLVTGVKRSWFLGKETITTDVTNSNPFIKVTDIKSAEVLNITPWYKKWYVWLGAGVLAGGFLVK